MLTDRGQAEMLLVAFTDAVAMTKRCAALLEGQSGTLAGQLRREIGGRLPVWEALIESVEDGEARPGQGSAKRAP